MTRMLKIAVLCLILTGCQQSLIDYTDKDKTYIQGECLHLTQAEAEVLMATEAWSVPSEPP